MTQKSHTLRLREYESASIGSEWDAARKVVSTRVVAELERLQAEQRKKYVSISRRRIKAQNYVGVVGVGDRTIEILPKTDEADDAARRRLVQMMSISGMLPHLEVGVADLAPSVPCLLDAFMKAYTRQLALEWRRGRISRYRKTDENRTYLRGKLLFHQQFHHNRFRPERFFTRADRFLADVPPSRLLKAGLDVCRRYGTADATRREAKSLLAEFHEVSEYNFTNAELEVIQADRRIARFDPLLNLAKLFLQGRVSDRPDGVATYSLLFDMNVVFERYIGCLLRRVCPLPYHVGLQVTGRSLVYRGQNRKFLLRPDIAVHRGKQFAVLIDTKWKLLDRAKSHEGVRQSDMYQAYAYAKEFGCSRVILLYPGFGDFRDCVASYRLPPKVAPDTPQIDICTIDIGRPSNEVCQDLKNLVFSSLRSETEAIRLNPSPVSSPHETESGGRRTDELTRADKFFLKVEKQLAEQLRSFLGRVLSSVEATHIEVKQLLFLMWRPEFPAGAKAVKLLVFEASGKLWTRVAGESGIPIEASDRYWERLSQIHSALRPVRLPDGKSSIKRVPISELERHWEDDLYDAIVSFTADVQP